MFKQLLQVHLLPLALAILMAWLSLTVLKFSSSGFSTKPILIEGEQNQMRGYYGNLVSGNQAELDFMASLKNKKQLTVFGSSEFNDSPYCSYNFLPDSLGLQTLGIGHAYHQNFSILCELLAANEFVEGSKICVILSPSWFHTAGTNTEAFVEFVRPNFINRIALDTQLESKYKVAVGKFIYDHSEELTGFTTGMNYLKDEFIYSNSSLLRWVNYTLKTIHTSTYHIDKIDYHVELKNIDPKTWKAERTELMDSLKKNFLVSITNNKLFVNDHYYQTYLVDSTGKLKVDSISSPNLTENQELEDFKLLVDFLSSRSTKCSFIIQPMNPYYYQHTERNLPLIDTLTGILEEKDIPYLNLYAKNKTDYDPATLKDVMHLGDYGWMKINYFLDSLYNEH